MVKKKKDVVESPPKKRGRPPKAKAEDKAEEVKTPKPKPSSPIYAYVQGFYDLQKTRIMLNNRLKAFERESAPSETKSTAKVDELFKSMETSEQIANRWLSNEIKNHPIYVAWLSKVRGVGPVISAGLVATIGDIKRFPNVAKLWAYSGLHVIDGHAAKRAKGEKANWSGFMKTLAWKAASSFVKAGGYYRGQYDAFKRQDAQKHPMAICLRCHKEFPRMIEDEDAISENPDEPVLKSVGGLCKTKGCGEKVRGKWQQTPLQYSNAHLHNRAMRKTSKLFLSHLWAAWRDVEGLPTVLPYPAEHMEGHADISDYHDAIDQKKSGV